MCPTTIVYGTGNSVGMECENLIARNFQSGTLPQIPNDRMGIFLAICRYWLNRIHPENDWTERVFALFDAYPEIPVSAMGIPVGWRHHPLWSS